MNFTVSSTIIAAIEAQQVYLTPVLGSYELAFQFAGTIHASTDDIYRWITISGARVTLRAQKGQVDIGFAVPDKATVIRQVKGIGHANVALKLLLQPHQLEVLESLRDGGDLHFALKFHGRGGSSAEAVFDQEEHYTDFHIDVPESSWVTQLNGSRAGRILLLEVKLPFNEGPAVPHPCLRHLNRAQQLLIQGDWRECVSECRQFAEELGGSNLAPALDRLSTGRKSMTKDERETVLLAALHHYCHLAAHSESRNGELDFGRADAKLAVSLAASLAEYHFRRS